MCGTGCSRRLETIWLPQKRVHLGVKKAQATLSQGLTTSNSFLLQPRSKLYTGGDSGRGRKGNKGGFSPEGPQIHCAGPCDFPLPALFSEPQCQPSVPTQLLQATDGALKTSPGSGPRVRMSAVTALPFHPPACC